LLEKRRSELLLLGVATFVLAIDQLTKALVLRYLPFQSPWNPIPFLRSIVTLNHVTNTGAAFGLFPEGSLFFTLIAVVVVIAIVVYYRHLPQNQRLVQVSLGLQLGGAIGNLLDRLHYGKVIDFIDFHFWPVFNVADSSIFIGVIILAYYLFFLSGKQVKQSERLDQPGS